MLTFVTREVRVFAGMRGRQRANALSGACQDTDATTAGRGTRPPSGDYAESARSGPSFSRMRFRARPHWSIL